MESEQRGDKQARPQTPGQPYQSQEEQCRVDGMEKDAAEVMTCRIECEELIVKGVRQPGQRMPVRRGGRRKGPLDVLPCQAVDVRVGGDIVAVVQHEERMAEHRTVDGEGRRENYERQPHHFPTRNNETLRRRSLRVRKLLSRERSCIRLSFLGRHQIDFTGLALKASDL